MLLKGESEAIEIVGVLLIGLCEFRYGLVVAALSQRNSAGEFMRQSHLSRILRCLGASAKSLKRIFPNSGRGCLLR